MKKIITAILALIALNSVWAQPVFTPLAKGASQYTINAYNYVKDSSHLNFNSKTDSIDAHMGLLASWPNLIIKEDGSKTAVWNMKSFAFLNSKDSKNSPYTVNPSLWREAKLNYIPGIFKVAEGMYQARGFGLANSTYIKGNTGWIVVDPLESGDNALAAFDSLKSVLKAQGQKPADSIAAIIYTHSHVDHYGGILGVTSMLEHGGIIYGPSGFLDHAISENTIAGNAMGRRATYMYGTLLPADSNRMVDAGLGVALSKGPSGIIPNTISLTGGIYNPDKRNIDGIEVHFWYTPGAEAPSEMMFYFPAKKALCASEEVTHTMHNVYSLRGAKVRDALAWSKFIDSTLTRYGETADVIFASHHWPVWGAGNISKLLTSQRDLYRYIHDQSMRMANQGSTPIEIAASIKLPESLDTIWANRGYYGTLSHNSKSVYNYYLGWFDGNPANLNPLTPQDAGAKYVEFMGGPKETINKAHASYKRGEYRWAAMVLNHLVFADPDNRDARYLLADVYEQLGYQSESAPWRNFYLTGAEELRVPNLHTRLPNSYPSNEVMDVMPLEQYLDFMAIHLVPDMEHDKLYNFKVGFNNQAANKPWMIISLQNNAIHYKILKEVPADIKYDAEIILPQDTLNVIITHGPVQGATAMKNAVTNHTATITGNSAAWYDFISMMQEYNFWFNIVTP